MSYRSHECQTSRRDFCGGFIDRDLWGFEASPDCRGNSHDHLGEKMQHPLVKSAVRLTLSNSMLHGESRFIEQCTRSTGPYSHHQIHRACSCSHSGAFRDVKHEIETHEQNHFLVFWKDQKPFDV